MTNPPASPVTANPTEPTLISPNKEDGSNIGIYDPGTISFPVKDYGYVSTTELPASMPKKCKADIDAAIGNAQSWTPDALPKKPSLLSQVEQKAASFLGLSDPAPALKPVSRLTEGVILGVVSTDPACQATPLHTPGGGIAPSHEIMTKG